MKRILIVEVNWLGDVLLSTPFIKAVKRHYKDSYLACLVVPRCTEVLTLNPYVDEIIPFDEEGPHGGVLGKLRLVRELRKGNFDTVFLLHRSFTRALIVALAGINSRIGYATKNRWVLLTKPIKLPLSPLHKVGRDRRVERMGDRGESRRKLEA